MPTLQSIGVHPQLREKLLSLTPAPIETPQALLSRDPASLALSLNVPLDQVYKVRTAVADALVAKSAHGQRALHIAASVDSEQEQEPLVVGAVSAFQLLSYQSLLDRESIPTGSNQLNNLLGGGGLAFGHVTQIQGPPASGKTQVALSCAALHAATGNKVHYLASGFGHGSLLPLVRRLQHFCTSQNYQSVVSNISFSKVCNAYEALAAIDTVSQDGTNNLMILDSVSGCLSGDLYGDDAGKDLIKKVAYSLRTLARHHGAAVLVTNGTVSSDGGVKPAMGQAWHVADVSVWFDIVQQEGGTNKKIRATLEHHHAVAATGNGQVTAEFRIVSSSSGIQDVGNDTEEQADNRGM